MSSLEHTVGIDQLLLQHEVEEFLRLEAERLDDFRLKEWIEMMTEDIKYRVPVRTTREKGAEDFSDVAYHFNENFNSLKTRVERFDSEFAWSENPPSRVRRYITNVRIHEQDDDRIRVRNNELVYRSQRDNADYDLISGYREDELAIVDGELKLAERTVYLDQTVLGTKSLSIFL